MVGVALREFRKASNWASDNRKISGISAAVKVTGSGGTVPEEGETVCCPQPMPMLITSQANAKLPTASLNFLNKPFPLVVR